MKQGRPKTDNHIKMMINFTEEIANKLKEKKEITGVPISLQVRTAVENYLKELGSNEKFSNEENLINNSKKVNNNLPESQNDLNKYNLIISLEKLIDLKNRGEISEEEYQIFKSKLIEI